MPVVLRLKRSGAKKRPFYRVVAADSRRQRDGRFLEIVGHYDPMRTPATVELKNEKIEKWLAQGAQPSEQVASLLRAAGMRWTPASKPKKSEEAKAKVKAAGAKRTRLKPRPASTRKTQRKATRKAGKSASAAKSAPA